MVLDPNGPGSRIEVSVDAGSGDTGHDGLIPVPQGDIPQAAERQDQGRQPEKRQQDPGAPDRDWNQDPSAGQVGIG